MKPEILRAILDHLNWNYGRGDIVHVGQHHGRNPIKVKLKMQFGYETAYCRVENRTVFFRGHQRTTAKGGPQT
jgi:hypothetical protein